MNIYLPIAALAPPGKEGALHLADAPKDGESLRQSASWPGGHLHHGCAFDAAGGVFKSKPASTNQDLLARRCACNQPILIGEDAAT